MNEHYLVESLDPENASLRSESAATLQVPAGWLPSSAVEGAAVIVEVSPGADGSTVRFRLAEGSTEPRGTDVGA